MNYKWEGDYRDVALELQWDLPEEDEVRLVREFAAIVFSRQQMDNWETGSTASNDDTWIDGLRRYARDDAIIKKPPPGRRRRRLLKSVSELTTEAEDGCPRAMLILADAYAWGFLGVKQNSNESNDWNRRACETYDPEALMNNTAMILWQMKEMKQPVPLFSDRQCRASSKLSSFLSRHFFFFFFIFCFLFFFFFLKKF